MLKTHYIEEAHQVTLVDWAALEKVDLPDHPAHGKPISDFLIAIPNGGRRNKREAARLKAQGVTAGVPDLFLHIPLNGLGGLWLEMKRPGGDGHTKGRLTPAQANKIEQLNALGYAADVVYGATDAIDSITGYLRSS